MRLLLKHDIKNNFLEIVALCVINIIICLLIGIVARFFTFDNLATTLIISTLLAGFVGVSIGTAVVLIMSIVKSFNNKLFTDEGYLTFVLPISIDKIIISKYLVNMLWVIITTISYIIGLLLLVLLLAGVEVPEIFEGILEIGKLIIQNPISVLLALIQLLVSLIFTFSCLFLTLAVLNCGKIKKGKLLVGIIIYSVIGNIISTISSILSLASLVIVNNGKHLLLDIVTFEDSLFGLAYDAGMIVMNINTFVIEVVACVGLYFLARFIIRHKLELE